MELRTWIAIGLMSMIGHGSTDDPSDISPDELMDKFPTRMVTEENCDKMCQVMDIIVPQISDESRENIEYILDCMMTRTGSKECLLENYKINEPPKELNEWKDVFCKTDDRAQILKDNFKCSISKYVSESLDPNFKPNDCEKQLKEKVSEIGRKGSETGFDDKLNEAMAEVFGQQVSDFDGNEL